MIITIANKTLVKCFKRNMYFNLRQVKSYLRVKKEDKKCIKFNQWNWLFRTAEAENAWTSDNSFFICSLWKYKAIEHRTREKEVVSSRGLSVVSRGLVGFEGE